MRKRIDILIKELRDRAEYLNSKTIYSTPDFVTDSQLMYEAANRLQAIEVLEKELEQIRQDFTN